MGTKIKCLVLQTGTQGTSSTGARGNPVSQEVTQTVLHWGSGLSTTLTHGAPSVLANQSSPALGPWSSVHTHPVALRTPGKQPQSVYFKASVKSTTPIPRTGEDELVTWMPGFPIEFHLHNTQQLDGLPAGQ